MDVLDDLEWFIFSSPIIPLDYLKKNLYHWTPRVTIPPQPLKHTLKLRRSSGLANRNEEIKQDQLPFFIFAFWTWMMTLDFDVFMAMLLGILALIVTSSSISSTHVDAASPILDVSYLNRSSFPAGFIFGTASSAYQVHSYNFFIFYFLLSINLNHFPTLLFIVLK